MADNTQLEQAQTPLGDLIATDDITSGVASGAKAQRVKTGFGPDGSYFDAERAAPFPVELGVETPVTTLDTVATVAAGANADLDGAQIGVGLTGQLVALIITASVPVKATLKTVTNAADGPNLAVFFVGAGDTKIFVMPAKRFFTVAHDGGAGLDAFRVNILNSDTTQAADVYVTFLFDQV